MRILVTGATGFLGNHFITSLLDMGHEIVATSTDVNKAKYCTWYDKVEYISYRMEAVKDSQNLYKMFQNPDRMIHLSWQGLPNYNDSFHLSCNFLANYHFLTNLLENGLNNVTVTGTCLEYGLKEGCLTENEETNPVCYYGLAKDTLRKALFLNSALKDISLKWVRLFYMYGEGQAKTSLFSQLTDAIDRGDKSFNMSKGDQIRDFLPIKTVVQNCIKIALHDDVQGIINCCSGVPVSVREMVESVIKEAKADIKLNLGYYQYPDYEPLSFWGNANKLKQIINDTNGR